MSKDNLKLWESVEKTNPNYTKKAKVGMVNVTAIDPQYQIKQATKQFGSYGEKWGFKNINLNFDLVEKLNMVVFKGVFFFPDGQFEIINSCKLYMDRKLTMIDDNFAKKVETDSLTKALSKLGFSADIFLGKYDNVRYFNEIQKEFAEDLTKEELKEFELQVSKAKDENELTEIYNSDIRFRVNPYVTKLLTDKRLEIQNSKQIS